MGCNSKSLTSPLNSVGTKNFIESGQFFPISPQNYFDN